MSKLNQQKQSVNTDFPNIRPSLDLRFALAKKLDPRVTFSRGSVGTYVGPDGLIKTASANEPRFDHNPITGECLGLLLEDDYANLLTYSQDFSNAVWTKNGVGISTNITTAPDGTVTADKIVEDTTRSTHITYFTRTGSNETVTFSIFCKAAERNIVLLQLSNFLNAAINAVFNLSTGTVISLGANSADYTNNSASIIPYPNGWYRCILRTTKGTVNTNNIPTFRAIPSLSQTTYQGDGNSGIYVWGAQLERENFATSYIPTVASTVTRSEDLVTITGTNFSSWYNQTEGTVYCNYDRIGTKLNNTGPSTPLGLNLESVNNSMSLIGGLETSAQRRLDVTSSGATLSQLVFTDAEIQKTSHKVVFSYKENYVNGSYNGQAILRDLNVLIPTVSQMNIGKAYPSDSNILNGHIKRIAYYPIQITEKQLINLTS